MKRLASLICFLAGSAGPFNNRVHESRESLAQEPGTIVAADKRVQGRSYVFQKTGETIQYALFVPSNYETVKKWPLIVGLHGAGRPYRLAHGLRRPGGFRPARRVHYGGAARVSVARWVRWAIPNTAAAGTPPPGAHRLKRRRWRKRRRVCLPISVS